MFGAAMGSGIATLLNGGDIGDALKSGLIAGATGAVYNKLDGKTLSSALSDPSARFSQAFEGAKASFSNPSDGFRGEGKLFDKFRAPDLGTSSVTDLGTASVTDVSPNTVNQELGAPDYLKDVPPPPPLEPSFLDTAGDVMFRGGETKAGVLEAQQAAGKAAYDAGIAGNMGEVGARAYAKSAFEDAAPGMLAKYGPSVLAGTALAAGAGAFETPEQEAVNLAGRNPDGTVITGSDLIDADPSKYLIGELGNLRLNPETGEYEEIASMASSMYTDPTNYSTMPAMSPNDYLRSSVPSGPFARPYVQAAAEGGPIFPRRNGGIAPTEGVAGQDSVRAMLMPGEFVMTTDAVRGLGNGNLNSGIQNMYSVMRNLESRGRNTA
jgi:hypothetical protein